MLQPKRRKSINKNVDFGQIKIQFKDIFIITVLIVLTVFIILEVMN